MSQIVHCRSCEHKGLQKVLQLGKTPLANALLQEDQLSQEEQSYPLELVFCPGCSLLQITETVEPEKLFSHYLYFSSFSDTMLAHAKTLVERLIQERKLGKESLVIELASNDGYLLQYYQKRGIHVLGIEPAENVAQVAKQRGIPTRQTFFGTEEAERLLEEGKVADIVHVHNVLAHVADHHDFVKGMQMILKEDGMVVIEAPYVRDTLKHCEFDQIYHEHLCYFSLTSLRHLLRNHNLEVSHVELLPIHGGSLRVFVSHTGRMKPSRAVWSLLEEEKGWGVDQIDCYKDFAHRAKILRESLSTLLQDLKKQGKSIAAYGASAKGSTLLHFCGIGSDLLDFVVDRNTHKQGHFTPGTHLPISKPERLLEESPDVTLLLTWNFADEILKQQSEYRARGGKFIIPIPEPHIV